MVSVLKSANAVRTILRLGVRSRLRVKCVCVTVTEGKCKSTFAS